MGWAVADAAKASARPAPASAGLAVLNTMERYFFATILVTGGGFHWPVSAGDLGE